MNGVSYLLHKYNPMNGENWSVGFSNKSNWFLCSTKIKKKSTILKMSMKFILHNNNAKETINKLVKKVIFK